ncbi:MAG: DNA polymerase IV [Caloramator sp.]|nr:MAG: DNA polymerase IV [Caloramator sp.]
MRNILHVDLNAFYASVEQAEDKNLQGKPVAVAGDKEKRTGIILTASYEARRYGVKTGMTIGDALKLCRDLILVKPNFKRYVEYSNRVMDILRSFTPDVEVFSIDEAWLDVSGCEGLFGDGVEIANLIRKKIREELGITASVGVSYCKLMAKMASDLKKPDATSIIDEKDVPNIIWPMPVEELFGVGRRMKSRLNELGIFTIGDLANTPLSLLTNNFGKVGRYYWNYANGIDFSKVESSYDCIKGVGNSITTPKDLVDVKEISEIFMVLAESVGMRLRRMGFEGNVVEVVFRKSSFETIVRRHKVSQYIDTTVDIHSEALNLFLKNWDRSKIRLLGIRVTGLREKQKFEQISLFEDETKKKREKLDMCLDTIREKYGKYSVFRAITMQNDSNKTIRVLDKDEWIPMNSFNKGGGRI